MKKKHLDRYSPKYFTAWHEQIESKNWKSLPSIKIIIGL